MRKRKKWIILALVVIIGLGFFLATREPDIPEGSFLVVDIGGSYIDEPPSDLLGQLVGSRQKVLMDLLLELRKAKVDERLKGVILKITPLELDLAKVQEMRHTLQELREVGKPVIAWVMGEDLSGNLEYYLASAAEKIYFSENTLLPLSGLSATYIFLGGVWGKLDVDMQVEKIKEYKITGDFLNRETMSEPHREMANSLLDSLNDQFLAGIAEARGFTTEKVQSLINAPTVTVEDFQKSGLIDGVRYFDEILQELREEEGTEVNTVSLATYRQVKPSSLGLMQGPKMAVVYGVGGITSGKSRWRASGATMGAETIVEALQQAAQDDEVRAIVFRVDSPGGSALASDLIWRAVLAAKEKKPIVVSMSGLAASGGYYIAASATKIVAQPATLTGSIGVVFALPNVKGFLQKLGLNTETLSRGRYARLFDTSKSWSLEERQQVRRIADGVYQAFTRKVAQGRDLQLEDVYSLGRGRVWTGEQAKKRGLVDEWGGMDTALRMAKEEVGISAETEVELVFYPRSKRLLEALRERLQGQTEVAIILPQPLRKVLPSLSPFWAQTRGPLLAMPILLEIQ